MKRIIYINCCLSIFAICLSGVARADYKTDIGYTDLQNLLGSSTPTGANVSVAQVEASLTLNTDTDYPAYAPDTLNSQFAGKTFTFPGTASKITSGHASGVGMILYGNNAIAKDISNVTVYEANDWLSSLVAGSLSASRVTNHSWVGNADTSADNVTALRFTDRLVNTKESIQVVAMNNSDADTPLLGDAYNVISVGRTDGNQDRGTEALDSTYTAGRTSPSIVAPQTTTSMATPIVSAAAAVLIETGHNGGLTLSNGSTNIAGTGIVYNAERSETIKAALMAGADRVTNNTSIQANISDYRAAGHQTSNGLDDRYGAGQVNILHSYEIIAAGEQNSLEDGGVNAGQVFSNGFDYDPAFGGLNSTNRTGTYSFVADADTKFTAALVWNLSVPNSLNATPTLYNLNLELFDDTDNSVLASSASALDNTENLWVNLLAGHHYELKVLAGQTANFSWDYALAWHTDSSNLATIPIPAAIWLFASGISGFVFLKRPRKSVS